MRHGRKKQITPSLEGVILGRTKKARSYEGIRVVVVVVWRNWFIDLYSSFFFRIKKVPSSAPGEGGGTGRVTTARES